MKFKVLNLQSVLFLLNMNTMKKLILTTVCFVLLHSLTAQDRIINKPDSTRKENVNYVGINAGFTTGLGFSYIYWPNKNGIQIAFLPLFDKINKEYSLGLTYLRFLTENRYTNLFLYFGNHFTNIGSSQTIYNGGIGPGLQVGGESIKVHFMLGYAIYNVPINTMIRPTIELGIFYRF